MKIRFIKWGNVIDVCESNISMAKAFNRFHEVAVEARWTKPQDILKTFNNADIITCEPNSRIIFNIGANKYRLICGYFFGKNQTILYVKFVGTHEEYDKVDACKVNQFKST